MIRLSPEATQAVIDCIASRNSKAAPTFLLIDWDGRLHKIEGLTWPEATAFSVQNEWAIYNPRSHKMMGAYPPFDAKRREANPNSYYLKPVAVQLHGPTLHRSALNAGREIICGGTYTWEDKE